MKIQNTIGTGFTLALLTLSTAATAESWICENGDLMREIVVQRSTENAAPCSVVYNKETENQPSQILWTAQFDGAYCDTQADGLAEKLTGFGWTCDAFYPQ